jgi:hypothetical protein
MGWPHASKGRSSSGEIDDWSSDKPSMFTTSMRVLCTVTKYLTSWRGFEGCCEDQFAYRIIYMSIKY